MSAGVFRAVLSALVAAVVLSACTTVIARNPAPEAELERAAPYGITAPRSLRDWGDLVSPEASAALLEGQIAVVRSAFADDIAAGRTLHQTALLLSGGGPDGAFGAGILNGWTERGDRPDFTVVTGISTGAIVAVFAFLGSDYDATLEEIYTTYTTEQLLTRTVFAALLGGSAIVDTTGYRRLIESYIDDAVVEAIAAKARRGHALLIGTTNLDATRPVVWNITAIAATGHPDARRLIHDIVQASSAIPAVFPPVLVPVVTPEGRTYDEMHVDGGATQQVMLFSPSFSVRAIDKAVGVPFDRTLFAIINNKLVRPYRPVRPRIASIAGTAVSSLLSGAGHGDLYRIFAIANRDTMALNVVSIPPTFDMEPQEPFDPVYMRALFDLGYEYGVAGDRWTPHPPDFAP